MSLPLPLVDRFERLMVERLGAEKIDALITRENDVPGLQRADYLLAGRSVILEQKALESDPQQKIDAEVETLSARDDWPLFYGKAQLSDVTQRLPDAEQIMLRVFTKISRSVENAFKSADKQIRDTRLLLELPADTPGILVLLNEQIETIGPDVIKHRVAQLFHARNDAGEYRYSNVALVMLFTEAHVLLGADRTGRAPVMTFEGPTAAQAPTLMSHAERIVRAWANAHGWDLHQVDPDAMDAIQRKSAWHEVRSPTVKRHELWRRNYRNKPYLRELTDENFLEHGRRLIAMMTPHYLVGGTKLPSGTIQELTEGWTHFLEEAQARGIDLRELGPVRDETK